MVRYYIKGTPRLPKSKAFVYRQKDSYSCGPRVLQTALSIFGIEPKYSEIKKTCKTSRIDGTEVDNIAFAAKHYGLSVEESEGDLEKLKEAIDFGSIVVILWYTGKLVGEETGHVVLVFDYNDHYLFAFDPDHSLCTIPVTIIDQRLLKSSWSRRQDYSWMMILGQGEENSYGTSKETRVASGRFDTMPKL